MRLCGHEITKTPGQADFLSSRSVDLVLDVGANRGQYASGLRKQGYCGRIHSFEPVSGPFQILSALAARDPQWQVTQCAVGAAAGTAQINVSRNTVYSSIQQQTGMAAEFSRKSAIVATETVRVMTLDELAIDPASAIFLKIDTQGFEQQVLAGAMQLLPRCVGLQLELPVEHLYENVWSFAEAVTHLDQLGFLPAQFRMVNPIHDDPVSGIEFDCIFRRKRPVVCREL